jgi:histidinol-phosphatase (PHP family)
MLDLHNHTPLCKHAKGEPEEYVKKALEKEIKIYGFADHAPMNFDEKYRMDFSEMEKYENEIKKLKKKYENEIKILLGYEVDFTPKKFLDKRVLERKVDFLIGSVHFLDNWGFDNPEFIKEWDKRDVNDVYKEYFQYIKEMAESNLFDIVGHIDLVKVFGHKPAVPIKDLAKDAVKAIKKSGMCVEINTSGLRKPVGEIYPSNELLEIILNEGINITLSSDAHAPEQVGFRIKETLRDLKNMGVSELTYYENREKRTLKI